MSCSIPSVSHNIIKEPNSRQNKPVFATEIPLLPDAEVDIVDTVFIGEVVVSPPSVPLPPVALVFIAEVVVSPPSVPLPPVALVILECPLVAA